MTGSVEISPSATALRASLAKALRTLDTVLGIAVERHARLHGPETLLDPWRGMHLDRNEVTRLLAPDLGAGAAREAVPGLLASAAREAPAIAAAQRSFGLLDEDVAILLIAIAPHYDLKYERIYGYLNDDVGSRHPTLDLVANLLATDPAQRLDVLARLDDAAPLLATGLVSLRSRGERPRLACCLMPDPTWTSGLLGQPSLDPALAAWTRVISRPLDYGEVFDEHLAPYLAARRAGRRTPHLLLSGPHGTGKHALAQTIAARSAMRLVVVDARGWTTPAEVHENLRHAARASVFLHALLYVHGITRMTQRDGQLLRTLMEAVSGSNAMVLLASVAPIPPIPGVALDLRRLDLRFPGQATRMRLWRRALALHGAQVEEAALQRIAARFTLGPDQISQAAMDACATSTSPIAYRALAAATRAQCGAQLGALAQRIMPQAGIDSLVVPADVRTQLREICARATMREAVRETWGAGSVHARVHGISVLFAGPSGTGKTLAAEAVARELGFDMYRIDLASIVSKYIGETEQNLDRVFAAAEHANAVLFFDEADALFGKRSEVKDAHDRYANIEVAYLLQKMESFDGLAVLATNFKQNLDEAFARRLTFTVNFPFPEQAERRVLWEALWPPRAPRAEDVDLDWFAREFRLSGGAIRNTVLAAAHLAAHEGQPIARAHLLHATRREFQKLGKNIGASVGAEP